MSNDPFHLYGEAYRNLQKKIFQIFWPIFGVPLLLLRLHHVFASHNSFGMVLFGLLMVAVFSGIMAWIVSEVWVRVDKLLSRR